MHKCLFLQSRLWEETIWTPAIRRSAPKGRQQMGETGFCKNLRFSAVSCENLRFPAVFCANLRLTNLLIYRANRKSAKICKNLRKCAFRVRFLPFAVSLLARPEYGRKTYDVLACKVYLSHVSFPDMSGNKNRNFDLEIEELGPERLGRGFVWIPLSAGFGHLFWIWFA